MKDITKRDKGEEYIEQFPKFKKWINECVCCHRKGYAPNIDDKFNDENTVGRYYIKKYFSPLAINSGGMCEQCAKLLETKSAGKREFP